MYDLYSYNNKHNEANGWNNTDGANDNRDVYKRQQLAQVGNMMQTTAASAERVFEFLEEEEEIEVEKDAVPVDTLAGNVTFEHINFGYKDVYKRQDLQPSMKW